jgi:hypothetical protein
MAKMIPEIPVGAHPHGEALFYKWLAEGLPEDYRVFHGVHMLASSGDSMKRGETDFLILHKKKGFIVVEVKGGKVRRVPSKSQWISTSHSGEEHVIKDPFMQAERNMNTLAERIRESKVFGETGKQLPVTCGFAVAFPDGVAPDRDLPLHAQKGIVIDYRDKGRIEARVERLFEAWRNKRSGSRELTAQEYQDLLDKVLMARYEVTMPLNIRIEQEQDLLVALTEQQCMFLEAIPDSNRALFKGYAGTGKTQLLMERARRFASGGAKVLVLCYNQPLAQHLAQWASATATGDGGGSIKVAGMEYEPPAEGAAVAETTEFYDHMAPMVLEDAVESTGERFDCVLVDEGQDFRPEWFEAATKLLDPQGLDIFHIYYDEQQNIYGKELKFPFEAEAHLLNWNCRSTDNICAVTKKIGGVEVGSLPGSAKGERVRYFKYRKPEDQVAIVDDLVKKLVERGIEPWRIMVISSHRRPRSCMANVSRLGGYPLLDYSTPLEEEAIAFSSLHRAKGLESDVVIFCDVDGGEPYCSRSNQYVAVSRARHLLFVVHRADWRPA